MIKTANAISKKISYDEPPKIKNKSISIRADSPDNLMNPKKNFDEGRELSKKVLFPFL